MMEFLQYETGCARECSEVQNSTVSCLLKGYDPLNDAVDLTGKKEKSPADKGSTASFKKKKKN